MTVLTNKEYELEELLEQRYEQYRDEAKESFYLDAEHITQKVEHLIDNINNTVGIDDVFKVAQAIQTIMIMGEGYEYHDEYELEYDFYEEAETYVNDHFGTESADWMWLEVGPNCLKLTKSFYK